jgi:type I restriction enzyme, S subunit
MSFTESLDDIIKENRNKLLGTHLSWERVSLSCIVSILNGFAFSSDQFTKDRGMPLLRIRDIHNDKTEAYFEGEYDPLYIVNKGDLIIGMDGDFHCALWMGPDALLNQRVCKISLLENYYNKKFLTFLLPGYLSAINDATSSVTVKHLSSRTISEIPIPLPPFPEQHRIVTRIEELFSRLDAGVQALQRAKAQLQRYRQSVLQAAVEGRLTAEWRAAHPEVEPAEKLLEKILGDKRIHAGKSCNDPCLPKLDNLPKLPFGWTWASVDQLSEQIVDCLHSTPKFIANGKYCIDTTCIEPGRILFDKARFVSDETYRERIQRLKPETGDILFSREGTIGIAITVTDSVEFCLGQRMMMFRPSKGIISSYFMWALLSSVFKKQWEPKVTGTTAPHINIRDIRAMALPLTSYEEQAQIIEEIENLFSVMNEVQNTLDINLNRAAILRQSVLTRAFEGKLVPQDPNDEPASLLLERIRAERTKASPLMGRRRSPKTNQVSLIQ